MIGEKDKFWGGSEKVAVGAEVTPGSRLFQRWLSVTGNTWSPSVDSGSLAARMTTTGGSGWNWRRTWFSLYSGARPCRQWRVQCMVDMAPWTSDDDKWLLSRRGQWLACCQHCQLHHQELSNISAGSDDDWLVSAVHYWSFISFFVWQRWH